MMELKQIARRVTETVLREVGARFEIDWEDEAWGLTPSVLEELTDHAEISLFESLIDALDARYMMPEEPAP